MAFDVSAGFHEAGKAVANTAGAYALEAHRSDLYKEAMVLADQLASTRDEKQRAYGTSERLGKEKFEGEQGDKTRTTQLDVARTGAGATLGAAKLSSDAHRYGAEKSLEASKYHTDAISTPSEVRVAEWFTAASPEKRESYLQSVMVKHGMPAWALGGGVGTGGSAIPVNTGDDPAKAGVKKSEAASPFNSEAFKGVPEGVQNIVKAMIDGRIPLPSSFAMATPYWQSTMQVATKYDPSFDATTWASRNATRRAFTSGQESKAINAINTTMGHVDELHKDIVRISNGMVPLWNSIVNMTEREALGSDKQTNMKMTVMAVSSEARKVFAMTGGGGLTELQEWQSTFPINGSAEQQQGAIKKFIGLLDSRLGSLANQYNKGMGRAADPLSLLDPKPREVYKKLLGHEPESSTGYQTGKPPVAATPPSAPTATTQGTKAVPAQSTIPSPKTSGEYEALPRGSLYLHPDGDYRTKQ